MGAIVGNGEGESVVGVNVGEASVGNIVGSGVSVTNVGV